MIFGWFLSDIIVFILVIVFGALDFYSVKNITGRILVGLRFIHIFNISLLKFIFLLNKMVVKIRVSNLLIIIIISLIV